MFPLLLTLDNSWRRTPIGPGCVTGPLLPRSVWPVGMSYSDWLRMDWVSIPITSGGGDVIPLANGLRIPEIL